MSEAILCSSTDSIQRILEAVHTTASSDRPVRILLAPSGVAGIVAILERMQPRPMAEILREMKRDICLAEERARRKALAAEWIQPREPLRRRPQIVGGRNPIAPLARSNC